MRANDHGCGDGDADDYEGSDCNGSDDDDDDDDNGAVADLSIAMIISVIAQPSESAAHASR